MCLLRGPADRGDEIAGKSVKLYLAAHPCDKSLHRLDRVVPAAVEAPVDKLLVRVRAGRNSAPDGER